MSFINDFKELMTVTVTVAPLSSQDGFSKPTYGAAVSFKARVVREHKLVRDKEGQEVVSTAQCWINGNPVISPEAQVTLEDATTPAVVMIEQFQDERGPSHTKIYFL